MPSQKTFRTKQKLAKAGRQNRCVTSATVMDENTYPNMSGLSPNGFVSRAILKFNTMPSVVTGEGRSSISEFLLISIGVVMC
ncbi:hypothetical protein Ac2012v2_008171 [Leucoagaricus gongylophorus]